MSTTHTITVKGMDANHNVLATDTYSFSVGPPEPIDTPTNWVTASTPSNPNNEPYRPITVTFAKLEDAEEYKLTFNRRGHTAHSPPGWGVYNVVYGSGIRSNGGFSYDIGGRVLVETSNNVITFVDNMLTFDQTYDWTVTALGTDGVSLDSTPATGAVYIPGNDYDYDDDDD